MHERAGWRKDRMIDNIVQLYHCQIRAGAPEVAPPALHLFCSPWFALITGYAVLKGANCTQIIQLDIYYCLGIYTGQGCALLHKQWRAQGWVGF